MAIKLTHRTAEDRWKRFIVTINRHCREDGVYRGHLILDNLPVKELPKNLKKVFGGLSLRYCPLVKLPDDLFVVGNLNLTYSNLNKLPKNLEIGGNLIIFKTKIEELPEDMYVGYGVYYSGSSLHAKYNITELQKKYPFVGFFATP